MQGSLVTEVRLHDYPDAMYLTGYSALSCAYRPYVHVVRFYFLARARLVQPGLHLAFQFHPGCERAVAVFANSGMRIFPVGMYLP